jgi:tetratricopeptide (TPR) repeat protein
MRARQVSPPRRWPWRRFLAVAAVVALFLAAYANSWRSAFHFDDAHVVESNPAIRSLGTVGRLFTDARTFSSLPANQTYRPVVSLSLAVDYAVARAATGNGLDPRAYHATQLVLLALTAALLGALARRLYGAAARDEPALGRWAPAAALVAAALFAVHVGNTQVGNYISARSESLSAIGLLGAMLLYLRGGAWRRFHLYLVPMALGALAKPPAVMFAPLLLLWKLLEEEEIGPGTLRTRAGRAAVRRAALGALPAFVAAAALYAFVEGMNPPGQTYGGGDRLQYMWTQAWISVRYVGLFFFPTQLSADSDWKLLPSPLDPRVGVGIALLAVSLWGAWRAARARVTRPIAFGIAWFWIGLAPTAVVPLAELTNDHRPFLGFLGLTLAVVWGVVLLLRRVAPVAQAPRLAGGVAVILLLAHAAGTRARNRVWATEATLWADVVRTSPGNARGLMNYALTAMREARYVEARAMLDSAARLAPDYPLVFVNLGVAASGAGDTAAAAASFLHALALDSTGVDAHRYYGRWLASRGRAPEALAQYARAVQGRPQDVQARGERLLLLVAADARGGAAEEARAILALDPTDATARAIAAGHPSVDPAAAGSPPHGPSERWYLKGWELTQAGRHAEAVQAYREAVASDSSNATAWNNLGWSLGKLGFFDAAEPALARAVDLEPANALARNNLAWVRSMRRGLADAR